MIYAILSLFSIPIGTAFGVYALWVLMQPETAKLFSSAPEIPGDESPVDQ